MPSKSARNVVGSCGVIISVMLCSQVHANLGAAGIPLDLFDTIVSADAFEKLKPSPDIFLAAAAQLGVPPANCVVIEDAVAGVQAARAAGGWVGGCLLAPFLPCPLQGRALG